MFGKKKSWDIYIILHAGFVCFGCFSDSVNKFAATNCMFIRDAYFFCPWSLFVRSLIYLSHGAEFVILRNSLVCLWEKILLLCIQAGAESGGVEGGREGALAPPDPAQNFPFLCIKILFSYLILLY